MSIVTGQVALSATPQPLSVTPLGAGAFTVKALSTNVNAAYWGNSTVTTATGHAIEQSETFAFERGPRTGEGAYDLTPDQFYVVGSNGDKITWAAFR